MFNRRGLSDRAAAWSRLGGEFGLAGRRLRRAPGYAAPVLINLMLAIGAAAGIFAVLDAIVLRPLPYPEPDRLVLVEHEMPGIPMAGEPTLFGGFQGQVLDYREHSRLIDEIGAYGLYDASVGNGGGAEYVRAIHVTAGVLRALGARVLHGRLFRDQEPATEQKGRGAVLLSQQTWARRYGAEQPAIGTTLRVDGAESEVLGIVGAQGPFPGEPIAVWTPRTDSQIRDTPQLLVQGLVVRMAEGIEPAALARELDEIIVGLPERLPDDFIRRTVEEGRLRVRVTPLTEVVVGPVRGSLWMLTAAAGLIMLAALANVTGLVLLRCEARRREQAVRRALGAGGLDLVIQNLAEAALLGGATLLGALALARIGIGALMRWGPDLPRAAELAFGPRAGIVAFVLTAGTVAWLLGVQTLFPGRLAQTLRSSGSGPAGERAPARMRTVMAAVELAVAVVLLVASGLVLRSFTALNRVDPGFEPEGVVTFRVPFPALEIQQAGGFAGATALYDRLAERLAAVPGVDSVGYASCVPFAHTCGLEGLTLLPAEPAVGVTQEQRLFGVLQASPGYHRTLAIPLIRGRFFERADHEQRSNAAIVSAGVAEALWPGESALGRQIGTPDLPSWTPFTIVGVVGETRHTSLAAPAEPLVYLPVVMREQAFELSAVTFVVHGSVPPLSLIEEMRAVMAATRADIPLADVTTLSAALSRSTSRLRVALSLVGTAALATLILAATGVYSVIAYAVSLRRAEFGIRLALGAQAGDLRQIVLRQAATVSGAGVLVGFAAAAIGGRLLESTLFDIEPTDPATYVTVATLLSFTALVASYLPARRAAATDAAEVLRGD